MPSYVVTGSARGIGLAFVKQLSADAAKTVFAIVRNKSTASNLTELGRSNVVVIEADVTDAQSLTAAAVEQAGRDVLEEDLLSRFKLNAISVVHSTNAFLPLLRKGDTKKVATISSSAGDAGLTLAAGLTAQPAYAIAKAATNMVVAKFAAELKAEGFVFLAISPGVVDVSGTNVAPVPEETTAELVKLRASIYKVSSDFKGPLSPEESVRMQLEVIHRWRVEDTGAFVSHKGNKEWM
ncbi:hypothetical protein C8R46DRAFT_1300796 [Mycena filopes]|nr:hypothetical protein C8R46DRAFT_1300796 [Mycena filopes]